MPLGKNLKKLFRRRSKPQSEFKSNVESTLRAARPGPEISLDGKTNTSQGTEISTSSLLQPSERSETDFGSRDSILRGEPIVEERLATRMIVEEEATSSTNDSKSMQSSNENKSQFAGRSESGGNDGSMDEVSPLLSDQRQSTTSTTTFGSDINRDPPDVAAAYNRIPLLEQTTLPRGGISVDTQAVGRVQVC